MSRTVSDIANEANDQLYLCIQSIQVFNNNGSLTHYNNAVIHFDILEERINELKKLLEIITPFKPPDTENTHGEEQA